MTTHLTGMATALRFLSVDMVNAANSGHPGAPLGMADIATVLFSKHLKFDPKNPAWFNRDRFILSNGHASAMLYSLLYLTGYEDCSLDDLKNFRQMDSVTAGHPEYGYLSGIEATTGPLGQGIAMSVGMALAEKKYRANFGSDVCDHYTYVFAGDGCLMEGVSYEAISFAGHHQLNKLIVLWDNNEITIDGRTDLTQSEDIPARFKAMKWNVLECDGHDFDSIDAAITEAKQSDRPVLINCKTIIGKSCFNLENTSKVHGAPIGAEGREHMTHCLEWPHAPFEIPSDIKQNWEDCATSSDVWEQSLSENTRSELDSLMAGRISGDTFSALDTYKKSVADEQPAQPTRKCIGSLLDVIYPSMPQLVGGSADLAPANNVKPADMPVISRDDASGQYIHFGIREHAMAAIANGLALSGLRTYAATFLCFFDYLKPALRLSSLMHLPVLYIGTHDSIQLGEDGPTHQPIEHLASYRAQPNLLTFRPCDGVEVAECMEIALQQFDTPSILALSRDKLPTLRKDVTDNQSARGAYAIKDCDQPDIILIATGSEVSLAMETADILEKNGEAVRVISMPCMELFDSQDIEYQESLLPEDVFTVSIEAGSTFGWERYANLTIGLDTFGASGPYKEVYKSFELTPDAIVAKINDILD